MRRKEFYPWTPSLTTLATRHGLACCFLSFFYTRHGRRGRERPPRTGTNTEKNFTTKLPLAQHSDWARDWRALRKEPSASPDRARPKHPSPGSLLHQAHGHACEPPGFYVCEIMLQSHGKQICVPPAWQKRHAPCKKLRATSLLPVAPPSTHGAKGTNKSTTTHRRQVVTC